MTLDHHFDIRTVTLGINLKDCMDRDLDWLIKQAQARIIEKGQLLNHCADRLEQKYGIPITNRRISITPASLLLEPLPRKTITAVKLAKALDAAAKKADIDFLGGFGAMVQKGATAAEENLIDAIPEALSQTDRICGFLNLASTLAGINMNAVVKVGHIISDLAHRSEKGIGCAKLAVFANVPEDSPFMAGAHHGIGEPDYSLNIGISGPGVVRSVVAQNPDCDLTQLSEVIKRTVFKITRAGELIGRELAGLMKVDFGIVDISLAPTTSTGDSVAEIIEAMGVGRMGCPGTTAALALLIDAVKKGGAMASGNVGGLSGTFIPVSEDAGMIRAVRSGHPDSGQARSPHQRLLGGPGHVRRAGRHRAGDHLRDHRRRAVHRGRQQQDHERPHHAGPRRQAREHRPFRRPARLGPCHEDPNQVHLGQVRPASRPDALPHSFFAKLRFEGH